MYIAEYIIPGCLEFVDLRKTKILARCKFIMKC